LKLFEAIRHRPSTAPLVAKLAPSSGPPKSKCLAPPLCTRNNQWWSAK